MNAVCAVRTRRISSLYLKSAVSDCRHKEEYLFVRSSSFKKIVRFALWNQ